MGWIACPETSVTDMNSTLLNAPEERISHQYRGGSLKSRNLLILLGNDIMQRPA
jgi:hypothetical protein